MYLRCTNTTKENQTTTHRLILKCRLDSIIDTNYLVGVERSLQVPTMNAKEWANSEHWIASDYIFTYLHATVARNWLSLSLFHCLFLCNCLVEPVTVFIVSYTRLYYIWAKIADFSLCLLSTQEKNGWVSMCASSHQSSPVCYCSMSVFNTYSFIIETQKKETPLLWIVILN